MSVEVIRNKQHVAKKTHTCMFCNGKIEAGTRYERSTCVYDGVVYDWASHIACDKVASALRMYDRIYSDGLDGDQFREFIDEYVYEKHYDNEIDDIAKDWQLSYKELAEKILKEIEDGR